MLLEPIFCFCLLVSLFLYIRQRSFLFHPKMLKRLSGIRPNFFYLVLFRVLNALVVDTYFNPDEFWQGPEVAHNMVFGYGHLTWEWRARAKLRGAAHPFLFFAIPYKMLALLGLDSPALVAYLPRVIQGVVAAVGG